jgi:N-acetylglucosamine-6-phosphate deacetylase
LEPAVSKNALLAIDAGTVYTPRDRISPARIVIEGKSIVEFGSPNQVPVPSRAEQVDATSLIVTPGFIEPHIHGCGGVDVMDGTYDTLNVISRIVARHGTTSFLATTVSSPANVLLAALERLASMASKNFDGAQLLGIHLEGPFINRVTRGTHKETNILDPDADLFHTFIMASRSTVRLVTIAPELDGSPAISAMAARFGIRVAMGHSNAAWEQASSAVENGVCYAVHTFNAMRPFLHRDPGIAGAVLTDERVFTEIIADGVHVHPVAVRLLARAKAPDRVLLVTDAISATDMPDGEYVLGPDHIRVSNGVCRDSDGRLAGSTLTQDVALKNYVDWTGVSVQTALLALTENPAKALGLHGKGVIQAGADADLTVIDSDFHVMKTYVGGKMVFQR